jgi:putative IMPACT (imprinted ancient) family translation regulator
VLLGAGGLTRAYRAAVAEAVLGARRVTRAPRQRVAILATYDVAAQLEAEARRRGWAVGDAAYGEAVEREFAVAEDQLPALTALAAELSAGRATVMPGETAYVDL